MAFLSRYSHYSIRLLMYLATCDDTATISEVAEWYGISRHHLAKISMNLQRAGFIKTKRGLNGGITLSRPANSVVLGDLIRHTEANALNQPSCHTLPGRIIERAKNEFLHHLDRYTLADLLAEKAM